MNKIFSAAIITILATFGMGATAQETTTQDAYPVGTNAEIQIGQAYGVENFDDWSVVCLKTDQAKDPCHAYQAIVIDGDKPIAEVSIFLLPPGGVALAGAEFITPLGTLLQSQAILTIDGGAPKFYAFSWCTAYGCIARAGFTGPDLDALKAGSTAILTVRSFDNPDAPLNLRLSLKGFTAAFEKASE